MTRRLSRSRVLLAWLLLAAPAGHAAGRVTPHPDAPPETAQFAFLVGDWDCKTRFLKPDGSGTVEGRARWTGYFILDGWAIQDDWIGYPPGGGESRGTNVRSFNPQTGKWDNRWLAQGNLQWKYFEAEQRGDTMVMIGGKGTDPRGEFIDRNVFHDIGPDGWRWRKDRSYDGGESWIEGIGTIDATRRKAASGDLIATTERYDFRSNFWINLNHTLHKMAGAEARTPVGTDQKRIVEALTPAEREIWDRAVGYYRDHLASRNIRRDDALYELKRWSVTLDPGDRLRSERFDAEWLSVLNAVAPVYRERFWPAHDEQNRQVVARHLPAIRSIETAVFRRVASLAAEPWPEGLIRVDVSYYSNWAGAYTTTRPTHVVMSSVDIQPPRNWLELLFHEPCHAIIGPGWSTVGETINEIAKGQGVSPPRQLWHAILFYVSGRAVQDALAAQEVEHPLYMFDKKVFEQYHEALRRDFEPYVAGETGLRDAISAVVAAVSGES